ncbi:MAG TPA: helix-turn-helix transcriptional regulator, partial [Ramlibacter sp.]|nr:helix-turn-helix transcriptional regulator [Ramlibacter sp.]
IRLDFPAPSTTVGRVSHPAKLDKLVSGIYSAGVDSARWPEFMANLASELHAGFGNLWLHDFSEDAGPGHQGGDVSAVTGLDAVSIAGYWSHYAGLNVWLPNARNLAEGSLTVSSALYPDRLLPDTEFHDGFLHPNDLFYALGSSIVKQGSRDVKMSFVRSKRAGGYTAGELQMVQGLMPHLKNAVVLHRELYRARLLAASALAALELAPVGVILLANSGMLLHANGRAHELCNRSGALGFKGGHLHAASAGATAQLQRLIRDAVRTSTGHGVGAGGALELKGPAGRRLHALVSPLPLDSAISSGEAMAAIFCSDPDAEVGALSQRLEVTYGMTRAEALLTEALVNGQSLQEYADSKSRAINTVRTQLKMAAAKTGARTQADLVRIVLTGPAIFKPVQNASS